MDKPTAAIIDRLAKEYNVTLDSDNRRYLASLMQRWSDAKTNREANIIDAEMVSYVKDLACWQKHPTPLSAESK